MNLKSKLNNVLDQVVTAVIDKSTKAKQVVTLTVNTAKTVHALAYEFVELVHKVQEHELILKRLVAFHDEVMLFSQESAVPDLSLPTTKKVDPKANKPN